MGLRRIVPLLLLFQLGLSVDIVVETALGDFEKQHDHEQLLLGGTYRVHWTLDRNASVFHLGLVVETKGWVGFGLASRGGMKGADILVGFVNDSTGEVVLKDMWSNHYATPFEDECQDWTLVSGAQKCSVGRCFIIHHHRSDERPRQRRQMAGRSPFLRRPRQQGSFWFSWGQARDRNVTVWIKR